MNTETVTTTAHLEHPPQPGPAQRRQPARRVGVLDRAALHLGLALITWGRRPVRADPREELALNAETRQARLDAERLREHYRAVHLPRIL